MMEQGGWEKPAPHPRTSLGKLRTGRRLEEQKWFSSDLTTSVLTVSVTPRKRPSAWQGSVSPGYHHAPHLCKSPWPHALQEVGSREQGCQDAAWAPEPTQKVSPGVKQAGRTHLPQAREKLL